MNEYKVFWSFDNGRTLEHIGYEKLDDNGNYVFKRINTDTKELRKDWHLGMITDNQGNAKFYRFPYIGKTGIEDNKIYANSSIVEFIVLVDGRNEPLGFRGVFCWNHMDLRYKIHIIGKTNGMVLDYSFTEMSNFKIIGTLQEDKHLIGEK